MIFPLTTAYGLALYIAGAILLLDALTESISIRWDRKYTKPITRTIVGVTVSCVAIFIYRVPLALG